MTKKIERLGNNGCKKRPRGGDAVKKLTESLIKNWKLEAVDGSEWKFL